MHAQSDNVIATINAKAMACSSTMYNEVKLQQFVMENKAINTVKKTKIDYYMNVWGGWYSVNGEAQSMNDIPS